MVLSSMVYEGKVFKELPDWLGSDLVTINNGVMTRFCNDNEKR